MKKKIVLLILIFSFFVFSNTLIFNNKAFYINSNWANEEILKQLGFRFVKNDKIFMVFNNDLFIGKDGDFTLNFEKTFNNAYKIDDSVLYINLDFLKNYLKLKIFEKDKEKIYYDKLPELKSINLEENNLSLYFSSEISKELLNLEIDNRDLIITIEPILGDPLIIGNINFQKAKNKILIFMLNNKLKPVPIISYQKNIVKITLNFTEEEKRIIKNGLIWERKVEKFNNEKYLINYLKIDPKKVEIIPVISSKGIGTREDLREILKANNCIAGINANYFDPSTNLPIDLIIKDGKILSDKYSLRPTFIITYTNEVFIKRINLEINIYLGDLLFLVKGVNTIAKGEVLLYTDEFSLKIPKDEEKVYYQIKDNKIISIGYIENAPEGAMVLSISKKYEKYLSNVTPGTKIDLVLNSDFPFPIKHAIGAGPLLIENGKKLIDSSEEKLRYSNGLALSKTTRTIIAITKEGRVDFIVIEGYNNTGGMNYDIATDFLISKGYFYAMMLDGGGSGAMVIQNEVVNQDGQIQRGIPVGLGIK
ncbi:hypothetical protein SU69_09295 [Thermosipho melanesiensis]|uniref:Phosphodiester glycosidase domain-containing protein n=2 Tax=Thermosipho melanesiensis TaxID=46541 RepID=A6LP25_THEM4|nr:phosphodiester glycosidase family protein [Thermosipho melanesiensis]ABR31676.1 hypothetical protein Tmel_1841 [Thermosipho melanesiensis BI429]APT74703.1 hypothetical protein BW47_09675 [Thermosipho melanesiensis]OOC35200.1 hypothetical protein SU69_09295 [Thermosipho melanesiensis]OOC35410.1 hypothetical protein SU70_09305 [Thermosipho melanesiensis]OOC36661.1 hypothetical protein SU68_09365 [Thermosipho melanesiensis]